MTWFEANTFTFGREAFISNSELGKTVLQELYRLTYTTTKVAGLTSEVAAFETGAASQFAKKAIEFINF